jgi:hypothetical protein
MPSIGYAARISKGSGAEPVIPKYSSQAKKLFKIASELAVEEAAALSDLADGLKKDKVLDKVEFFYLPVLRSYTEKPYSLSEETNGVMYYIPSTLREELFNLEIMGVSDGIGPETLVRRRRENVDFAFNSSGMTPRPSEPINITNQIVAWFKCDDSHICIYPTGEKLYRKFIGVPKSKWRFSGINYQNKPVHVESQPVPVCLMLKNVKEADVKKIAGRVGAFLVAMGGRVWL